VPRDPEKKKMTMYPNPALAPMKKKLTREIKNIIKTRRYKNKNQI
jgi:hypothetical protein